MAGRISNGSPSCHMERFNDHDEYCHQSRINNCPIRGIHSFAICSSSYPAPLFRTSRGIARVGQLSLANGSQPAGVLHARNFTVGWIGRAVERFSYSPQCPIQEPLQRTHGVPRLLIGSFSVGIAVGPRSGGAMVDGLEKVTPRRTPFRLAMHVNMLLEKAVFRGVLRAHFVIRTLTALHLFQQPLRSAEQISPPFIA